MKFNTIYCAFATGFMSATLVITAILSYKSLFWHYIVLAFYSYLTIMFIISLIEQYKKELACKREK